MKNIHNRALFYLATSTLKVIADSKSVKERPVEVKRWKGGRKVFTIVSKLGQTKGTKTNSCIQLICDSSTYLVHVCRPLSILEPESSHDTLYHRGKRKLYIIC